MTDFKDRERAEESKFALDGETEFRIAARRNRLLGDWAAGLMQLTPGSRSFATADDVRNLLVSAVSLADKLEERNRH